MEKKCKHCEITLTSENAAKKNTKYFRNECKPCRSKDSTKWAVLNAEKRRAYINNYVRKTGKVKQYPCKTCQSLCYKVYAHSFCSVKCRFLFYVNKTENCWLWTGGKNRSGYGKFMMDNILTVASRAAFILFKGEIDDEKLVCHTCDKPSCVNPDHLWLGTGSENQQDSIKKGRHRHQRKLIGGSF